MELSRTNPKAAGRPRGEEPQQALAEFQAQIDGRSVRGIERVLSQFPSEGALAWGLERARLHRAWGQLELTTRLVIEEADRRGLGVGLLSAAENILVLEKDSRQEFIKQATRTPADPYVASLVMKNKDVTKRVLQRAGLQVPEGRLYSDIDSARTARQVFGASKAVVKPNSTSFGDGVTILEAEPPGKPGMRTWHSRFRWTSRSW